VAASIEAAVRKSSQKIEEELLVGGPEEGDED
jgi:recombination protein RecA